MIVATRFFMLVAVALAAFGLPSVAAAQNEVWKCIDAVGQAIYTNREQEAWRSNCVKVKREVTVVPAFRARELARNAGISTPDSDPREVEEGHVQRSFGSGIVVSESGDILTNAHLVRQCGTLRVTGGEQTLAAAVIAKDPDRDLAVIRTERPWGQPANLRTGAPLQPGEAVWVLGYPLTGLLAPQLNITQGIVSATAGMRGDPLKVQITNPVQTGNSGGPLVDQSGNVVGVVAGKLNALRVAKLTGELPQNVNFAIKLDAVTTFLNAARIGYQRASSTEPVEPVAVVRDARKYTVMIECGV